MPRYYSETFEVIRLGPDLGSPGNESAQWFFGHFYLSDGAYWASGFLSVRGALVGEFRLGCTYRVTFDRDSTDGREVVGVEPLRTASSG